MKQKDFAWLREIKDNSEKLFFILGPCAIENEKHSLKVAECLKKLSEKLKFNFIFKSSFDKANRMSVKSYRGVGINKGLRILEKVRNTIGVPVITDVHDVSQVASVSDVVDVIQTPALLCRQTDLIAAAGNTGKPVNVKKGQFMTAEGMQHIADKALSTGNKNIWLCERGASFGYNNLVVDYRNFSIMKSFGRPIVFDVTHSVQRPGGQGCASSGDRGLVPSLAASAVAQGIAGVFMEVHEDPEKAPCDGPNSVRLAHLENLVRYLIDLDTWAKERELPEVW